ncbi:MAG: DUF3467 domain-containing protein [Chloroflexi bacterium]|nr:DUF3467 domain-containing protein [Chloroflexota bacterium]
MSEQQSPVPMSVSSGPLEFSLPDDVTTIYANAAAVTMSSEDCLIMFGVRSPSDPNKVSTKAHIYLTLSHAKRLQQALTRTVAAIEANLGPIEVDPAARYNESQSKPKTGNS